MTLAIIAQLQALQPHIDKMDRLIAERARLLPLAHLLKSLPGVGKRLAPVLAAITATVSAAITTLQEDLRLFDDLLARTREARERSEQAQDACRSRTRGGNRV
jgi:hypothetical protein